MSKVPSFAGSLCNPELSNLKDTLKSERALLKARFEKGMSTVALINAHRRLVDSALIHSWRSLGFSRDVALLAVGGYGHGYLFPYSDVDILILLREAPIPELAVKIEEFIGCLWDLGLEVGHSVRTVQQCIDESARDITVRTALLEARALSGSRKLIRSLIDGTREALDPRSFCTAKRLEQENRHAKFLDSPYSLEPNIKESPGGLRDLQVIRWIAIACELGKTWLDLANKGFITRPEARQAQRHECFLQNLRIRLHYLAGRREDRLLFDYQDRLAKDLGYVNTLGKRASEQLMQRYYRSAKAISQLNILLMQNLEVALHNDQGYSTEIIDERFCIQRDLLDIRSENVFSNEPKAILESFLLMQQRPALKGMTAKTLRALWRGRELIDSRFRKNASNRENFLAILKQPRGIVHELRRMNQYGILGAYLPAYRLIIGQMQHDLFHVYTVDQHILMVIRNIRRFTMIEFAHEYPFCSRLIAGFERHWLLYVAAIFHDIAKGRGGDHSKLGMVDAKRFCRLHGLNNEDTDLVVFLVEHHLTMSAVAQKQDLADPDVVRRFADTVRSERRLIALYLITVADIRGTSPKVWNAWKGKLLEDLFHSADRLLRGEEIGFDNDIRRKQEDALRLLRLYGLADGIQEEFWKQLDVPYFLRHDSHEIAWQTRQLYRKLKTGVPVVCARPSPVGEGLQIMIYTRDQPQLFARICGYFGSINYNIVDAKVHTTRDGYALDSFQVLGGAKSAGYREMISLIEHDLAETLLEQKSLNVRSRGRISRQLRHFPIQPEVHIRPDERYQYHLLSITAGDQPGLLYNIALVLGRYGVNLHMAKVVTLGERAEDVFVVSGATLTNPGVTLLLEQELLETLAP